jgi:hypothetical protein
VAVAPPPPVYEPPPPPLKPPEAESGRPIMSVRVDVLSLIFDSRLGIEFESQVWKNFSAELTPVFVLSQTPLSLEVNSADVIQQHSDGLGPMSGVAVGLNYWLGSRPMRGTGLEVLFTNYAYTYTTSAPDSVSHVDQRLYGVINSRSVWGIFTMGAAFGIGAELNRDRRCFRGPDLNSATSNCAKDELLLAVDRAPNAGIVSVVDLHSSTYPVEFLFRLSMGVTF